MPEPGSGGNPDNCARNVGTHFADRDSCGRHADSPGPPPSPWRPPPRRHRAPLRERQLHTLPGASFASATPETRPETTLSLTVSPVPPDIPECHRSEWNHRNDEDGDCQDARQEVLASESVVEVTFESDRKSRVGTGRWYDAFTGNYVDAPGDLDIDHLVPLKNAHDSGG